MAAPVKVVRAEPFPLPMPEGHQILIAINGYTTICFWEIDIKPPAMDGQEPIDTTTQFNTQVHTMYPRVLKKWDAVSVQASYAPAVYLDVYRIINVVLNMCIEFPNQDNLAFWGFIQKFEPEALKEGDYPKANISIVIANFDPSEWSANIFMERPPVFLPFSGTND